jgi:cobalt/nickel transport system ATP-binding protein
MVMMTLLAARNLCYAYDGGQAALDDLSLTVTQGRRLAVLGPNGAGKTTLLLHLNGSLRPKSGHVELDGRAVGYGAADLAHWRSRVGLVLQDADDQLFAATVAQDVSFGPLNQGLSAAETRARVDEALDVLRIADLADRPPHLLSFGQKKRVALAGIFAMRPAVMIMDEPTAGLDHMGQRHLLAALARLEALGTTIAFSTHDVDLAYETADEVALFAKGKVVAQGPAAHILADRDLLAAAHLRMPVALELTLKARDLGKIGQDQPWPRTPSAALALF